MTADDILSHMDAVIIDVMDGKWRYTTEWHLRQLPKWRAATYVRMGHKLGVLNEERTKLLLDEIKALPTGEHRMKQIDNPYTMTRVNDYWM